MRHARHVPQPPDPRRRRLVIVLGAVLTAILLLALVWSIWRWPVTCERYIETAGAGTPDQ